MPDATSSSASSSATISRPASDTSYATVARDLGISVSQVTNHLHAARRQFRELALGHLRALSATDDEYRREAREIFGLEIEP